MNLSYQIDLYRIMFLRIKRSVVKGRVIVNAKPIFLLTLIDMIADKKIVNNEVYFNQELEERYIAKYNELLPNEKATPLYRPFYHLINDEFWHLNFTNEVTAESLTEKRLRENVRCGCFDNALWDLLQEENNRSFYSKLLIDNYLSR